MEPLPSQSGDAIEFDGRLHKVVLVSDGKETIITDHEKLQKILEILEQVPQLKCKDLSSVTISSQGIDTHKTLDLAASFFSFKGKPECSELFKRITEVARESIPASQTSDKEVKPSPATSDAPKVSKVAQPRFAALAAFFRRVRREVISLLRWFWSHTFGAIQNKILEKKDRATALEYHNMFFKAKKEDGQILLENGVLKASWSEIKEAANLVKQIFGDPAVEKRGQLLDVILFGKVLSKASDENSISYLQPIEEVAVPDIDPKEFTESIFTCPLAQYCFDGVTDLEDKDGLEKAIFDSLEAFTKDLDRSGHSIAGRSLEGIKGFTDMLLEYKEYLLQADKETLLKTLNVIEQSQFLELLKKVVPWDREWFLLLREKTGFSEMILNSTSFSEQEIEDLKGKCEADNSLIQELLRLKALEWMVLMNQRTVAKPYTHIQTVFSPDFIVGGGGFHGGDTTFDIAKNFDHFSIKLNDFNVSDPNGVEPIAKIDYAVELPSPWAALPANYQHKEGWSNLRLASNASLAAIEELEKITSKKN